MARSECVSCAFDSAQLREGAMSTGWTGGCPLAGFGNLTPATFVALVPHGNFAQQDDRVAQVSEPIETRSLSRHFARCYASHALQCPKQIPNSKSVCVCSGRNIPAGPSLPTPNQARAIFFNSSNRSVKKTNG